MLGEFDCMSNRSDLHILLQGNLFLLRYFFITKFNTFIIPLNNFFNISERTKYVIRLQHIIKFTLLLHKTSSINAENDHWNAYDANKVNENISNLEAMHTIVE